MLLSLTAHACEANQYTSTVRCLNDAYAISVCLFFFPHRQVLYMAVNR